MWPRGVTQTQRCDLPGRVISWLWLPLLPVPLLRTTRVQRLRTNSRRGAALRRREATWEGGQEEQDLRNHTQGFMVGVEGIL